MFNNPAVDGGGAQRRCRCKPGRVATDADDLWPTDSLAKRARLMMRTRADLVFGKVRQWNEREAPPPGAGPSLAGRVAGALLVRREAFDLVGPFDDTLATAETIEWVARAQDLGLHEAACNGLVLVRRIHGANTMLVHPGRDSDRLAVLRRVLSRRRAMVT